MTWGTPGFPLAFPHRKLSSQAQLDGAVSAATKAEAEELEARNACETGAPSVFLSFPEKDVKVCESDKRFRFHVVGISMDLRYFITLQIDFLHLFLGLLFVCHGQNLDSIFFPWITH